MSLFNAASQSIQTLHGGKGNAYNITFAWAYYIGGTQLDGLRNLPKELGFGAACDINDNIT